VLLFAYCPEPGALRGPDGEPVLPGDLIPLGLVSLRDELRAEAHNTLHAFAAAGVHLKIISGDHPQTVAALARQAGLDGANGDLRVISGLDLADMDEAEFARAAAEATIFGRITPAQKEHLVRCLQAQGHYVAMIGDGVNDVLSLKRAQLAVAMQSGSQATRSVADIVLLDDSFAILPAAVQEGRRIISGMQDVMRLVLAHTFYIVLIILFAAIAEVAFPTTPKMRSLITLLSVGIPTMAIAAWARPDLPPGSVLRSVLHFVAPAAFTVGIVSFAVYLVYLLQTGDLGLAQSALTTVALLCGLVLVVFVEPPTPIWVAGDDLSGDWRPAGVALAMLALYGVALYVPPVRDFYGLTPLPIADLLLLAGVAGAWALAVRTVWRRRLFERLLRLGGRPQPAGGAG
jgi:cation-transporting ATPase E